MGQAQRVVKSLNRQGGERGRGNGLIGVYPHAVWLMLKA